MEFSNVFFDSEKNSTFSMSSVSKVREVSNNLLHMTHACLIRTLNNTRLRLKTENTPISGHGNILVFNEKVRKPVDGYGFCSPLSTKFWWSSRSSGPLDGKPMVNTQCCISFVTGFFFSITLIDVVDYLVDPKAIPINLYDWGWRYI